MKQKKKYSVVVRTFFLLMLVILVQDFTSFYTIVSTDIATTVESYSYNTFTRTVINRKNNLETFMSSSWSNLSEISTTVSEAYIKNYGNQNGLSEEEKVKFLSDMTPSVVQMILMTGTTGGFLILDDGDEMQYSYSSVYLKSYDNVSQVVNSDNLMLARGPAEVSKQYNFSLVNNWSYGLLLNENTYPILSQPIEGANVTKSVEYLSYWHVSPDITNDKLKVLTCSMPVLDGEGNAIGVVGVEISQEYLFKFLPQNEFGESGSYGYILGDGQVDSFTPIITSGESILPLGTAVPTKDLFLENHDLEAIPREISLEEENFCVYYEPLNVYVNNSPFLHNEIWIMGMVDSQNMTSITQAFWDAMLQMLLVTLVFGIVISYFIGITVAKPIMKLSKAVSSYDINEQFTFPSSPIREIEELSTHIVKMQESILRSANRTEKIMDLMQKGVGSFEFVHGGKTVAVSRAVCKILDLEEGKAIPQEIFFHALAQLKSNVVPEVPHTYAVYGQKTSYFKVEEFIQEDVLLGVIEDSTRDVEALLVLNYERNYDVLTGIFNRRAFFQKAMSILETEELKTAGFVMFDLDNLKYVNDTFGHESGDVYIKRAATILHASLSPYGVVGRMSGDEFYAFIYGFDCKADLMKSLDGLYAQLEKEPITMPNNTEFKIRVSGGIAWYGEDSSDLEELQQFADFAMYKGKHTLKGEMRQFDKEMYQAESFMLSGKAELNRILDNELLNFVFQPIIDVTTGEIYGYEALMRPASDVLNSPLKLLQLATLEGKLWKVEKIALFKTLSLYKLHSDLFQNAKLFINSIPTETLKDEEYQELNHLYGDKFPDIVIEITEQEQQSDDFMEKKLEKLMSYHLDIALDGSGYANDIGLIKMRPDVVKIDRSLISNVHVDPSRQAIVQKIISFCQEQEICILGEGIETEQELEYLMEAGIRLAQGYYISRPMEMPNFNPSEINQKMAEINEKLAHK